MTDRDQSQRFAFLGYPPPLPTRAGAAALLGLAVFVQILLDSTIGIVIAVMVAVPAVFMLVRPARPGFYIEVSDQHLVVNVLIRNRIEFRDISSVGSHTPRYSRLWMNVENASIGFGRLFGGSLPYKSAPGEPDDRSVEVRLRKRVLIFMPFPPFIWPKTSWLFRVEDAPRLRALIQSKLDVVGAP